MIRRPPRSTLDRSSAASDVYKRQLVNGGTTIFQNVYVEGDIAMACDDLVNVSLNGNCQALITPGCLLYTSPSPRDRTRSRMPSSA